MENDRELLELAAKAAGVRYDTITEDGCVMRVANSGDDSCVWLRWNPLINDVDAIRLAMYLKLSLYINGNKCAAIRRAIVRAAAEIGRAME